MGRQGYKKEQKKNKQASNKEDHDIFGDVPQPKETNEINQCEDTSSRSKNREQKVEDKEHKLLGQYETDKQNRSAKKEIDSKLFISKEDETSLVEKDSEVKRKSAGKSNMKKSSSKNENKKTNKTDDNEQEKPTKEYTKMQNSENYTREEKEEDQKDDLSSRTKTALPIGTEEDLVIKETPEKQSNGNQKKEIQTSLELKEKESKENKKKENQTSEESKVKESKENKKKENRTSVESKVKGSKGKESENVNEYDEYGHKLLQNEMSPKPDSVKQQISDAHQQQQTVQKKMDMAHLDIETEQKDKAIIPESERYDVGEEGGQMDKTATHNLSIKTISDNVNKYDEHGHKFLQNERSTGPDSSKQIVTGSKQQQQTTQKEMEMAAIDRDTEQKDKAIIPEPVKDNVGKEGGQNDKTVIHNSSFENKEMTQNECISPKSMEKEENAPEMEAEGEAFKGNQSPDSHQSKLPSKITTKEKIKTIDNNQRDSVVRESCPKYESGSPLQKPKNTGIDNKDEGNEEEVVQKDNANSKADQKSDENKVIKNRLLEKEEIERNVPTKDSLNQAKLEQEEPADITDRKREKDDLDQASSSRMKVDKHSISSKELLSDVSQNDILDKKLTNVEQEKENIKKFASTKSPKEGRDEQLLEEGFVNTCKSQSTSKSNNENKDDTQIMVEKEKKENEAEMTHENSYSIKDNCKEKSLSTQSDKKTKKNLAKTLQKDIRDMENVIIQEGGKQELKLKDMFEKDVSQKDEESLNGCTKVGSSSTSKSKMSKKDKENLEKIESPSANTNECNIADTDSMKKSTVTNINNDTADPGSDNNASMNDNENNKESDVGSQDSFKTRIIR